MNRLIRISGFVLFWVFSSTSYAEPPCEPACESYEICYCVYGMCADSCCDSDLSTPVLGTCQEYCSNGRVNGIEECDDGLENSDTEPDACRTDCSFPRCGDGVVDVSGHPLDQNFRFEECDDGPRNSDFMPDACRLDCTEPSCGDGVIDVNEGEQCDNGENNSDLAGSLCNTQCLIPSCGNGVQEGAEICDDGNLDNTDGCTALCRRPVCGDGFVRTDIEACEYLTPFEPASCRYDCGIDAARCGDGTIDLGEQCDEGMENSDLPDATCRTDCQPARCGDGIVDTGEVCDKGANCAPDCSAIAPR